jgi:hypothetical protein
VNGTTLLAQSGHIWLWVSSLGSPQKAHLPLGFDMTKELDETKRLMGALVRMKPKPHEDMKVGKKAKKAKKAKAKVRT